ncbi:MAG TPA: hypothetical protein PLP19_10750 [bacterium]|nr:hypothetical protein [bacterium]HPN43958.1 hypothetical protein [bacterium]
MILNAVEKLKSVRDDFVHENTLEVTQNESYISELEVVGKKLLSLTQSTEKDFLQIGSEISKFSFDSNLLTELIRNATSSISGKEMELVIMQLDEMLARIKRYLLFNSDELDIKISILNKILKSIIKNSAPLKVLMRLVMELRMLGISTRIESARLHENNNSFMALSNDVNSLADVVATKIESIGNGLSNSKILLEKTITKITSFKLQQGLYAHTIIEKLLDCLKLLQKKHELSIQSINQITNENSVISNGVGEIISSLQFHDIARQKIEHVREALQSLVQQIENSSEHVNSDKHDSVLSGKVADVCQLQINQLNNTRIEIIQAGENLIHNETRIALISQTMVTKTRELLESSGENDNSFCNDTEKSIEQIKDSLFENARINFELNNSIYQISSMSQEMADFIKDIKLIGKKITLIALNAIINAEHLNRDGAALSILAEGIQRLADVTREHILGIADNMSEITNNATELLGGKSALEQKDTIEQVVNEMMTDFSNLITSLHNMFAVFNDQLEKVEIKGKTFLSALESSIEQITVHKTFDQVLNDSIMSLEKILSVTTYNGSGPDRDTKKRNVDIMNKNYTMESERKIHNSFIQVKKSSTFINPVVQPVTASSDQLGDNVELF